MQVLWWGGRMRKSIPKILVVIILTACASFVVSLSNAVAASNPGVRHIVVVVNKSRTVHFNNPFATVLVGSDAIADVRPMTDHTLYVQGKKVGTTNVSVFDKNMQLVEVVDLDVTFDMQSLQREIQSSTGNYSIRVSSNNGQVVLSGMARDAVAADRAVSLAKAFVPPTATIVNAMGIAPSQEVMLKVQFLEASRSAERSLGVSWFGTNSNGTRGVSTGTGVPNVTSQSGVSVVQSTATLLSGNTPFGVVLANLVNGGTNIDVMISALETKGLVRRLAEPNLVALSGDTAKFLAGGEFPVPILAGTGTGATPSVEFKKFGVSLAFSPTVLNDGLINLRIAPEVSELDPTAGVTISGFVIPGLVTRNAQTTVELRDGQSFAIAGLFQGKGVRNVSQLPWIGSVPVLGALFRSAAFQNNETDLVIIVTPHLVRPGSPMDHLATPFDRSLPANDADFFVNGQLEIPKRYTDYVTSGGDVHGPYGYIIPVEKGSTNTVYKGQVVR
jgi:pilus assembly protein CpaC